MTGPHLGSYLVVFLCAQAFVSAPLFGLDPSDAGVGPGWSLWLGCWELVLESVDHREEGPEEPVLVCLSPGETVDGVRITTLASGDTVLQESFVADGKRRTTEAPGCNAWQSAEWSSDGHRVFLSAETTCEGRTKRSVSGVSLIVPGGAWLDVQAIQSGDTKELVLRRYRRVSLERAEEVGFGEEHSGAMAQEGAVEVEAPLGIDDVIEAAAKIDPAAVEALLTESETRLDVNAEMLVRLADAHVAPDVIDLVVALAYPEAFRVSRASKSGGGGGGWMLGGGDYGLDWDPLGPYAYYYPFYYAPFGYYGYWYRPYSGYYLLTQRESAAESGGRVIQGRGYTRVKPKTARKARRRGAGAWGEGSGQSRTGDSSRGVSQAGYRSSGSSTSRTAKPKNKNKN